MEDLFKFKSSLNSIPFPPDDEFSGFKRTLYSALKYSLIAGLVGLLSYQLNLLGYLPLSSLDDLETIQKVRDFISNTVNTNVD